ncbi:hypothetical protein D3C75_764940 [compost metagenome]
MALIHAVFDIDIKRGLRQERGVHIALMSLEDWQQPLRQDSSSKAETRENDFGEAF